ncbi:DUF2306 domain-containing protein [Undibacterium sp. SXout11W]|uniref:DUF2306 domain-containing protein n=1 Tax=Undibacterium sp. SXout11W TaxID=3413050 RepID=UPI003BF3D8F6
MSISGITETRTNRSSDPASQSASTTQFPQKRSLRELATKTLSAATVFWFVVTIIGQAFLFVYIISFYGRAVLGGDWLRVNKVLVAGYIRGDTMGNVALAIHLVIAAMITASGPLQLMPKLRVRFPRFHRWNGRIYLSIAVITSVVGSYMVWTRPIIGDLTQHIGTTSNAVVILLCVFFTLRHALAGQFAMHRRWALRLYLAVSGVWFFRVALMFSLLVNRGAVGFNPDTFTGPFLSILSFAQYIVPLTVLEIYLRVKDKQRPAAQLTTAAGIFVLTIAMGIGIFGAALMMWLPHIIK